MFTEYSNININIKNLLYTNKKMVSGFLTGFTSIITDVKTKIIVKPFLFEYIKQRNVYKHMENNRILVLYIINCSFIQGTGHLRRFITVKEYLTDYSFVLLVKKDIGTEEIINELKNELKDTDIYYFENNLINQLKTNNLFNKIDIIFFDCKTVDEKIYLFLKNNNKFIVVFDDNSTYISKYADILFDANIHKKVYIKGKTTEEDTINDNNLFYGNKYIIFNKNLLKKNPKREIQRKVENVFVCFGGTDPEKIVERILKLSKMYNKMTYFVFTNHKIKVIPENVNVIHNKDSISEYMLNSDVGLISGGIILYETLYTGLPVIVINQNEDQVKNCSFYLKNNIIISLGMNNKVSDDDIMNAFTKLTNDFNQRLFMSKKGMSFVDGRGIFRLKELLKKKLAK